MLLLKIVQNRLFHLDLGTRCLGDKDFSMCATTFAPYPYIYPYPAACLLLHLHRITSVFVLGTHSLPHSFSLHCLSIKNHKYSQYIIATYCGVHARYSNATVLDLELEKNQSGRAIVFISSILSSVQFSSVQFNQGSIQSIRNQSYYYCNCEDFEWEIR